MHVSDLGIAPTIDQDDRKCPRQFWLRYHGAEQEETGPGQQLMFDQGHSLEEKAVEMLKHGLDNDTRIIGTQMDITPGLPYSFTEGWMLSYGKDDQYMVVDFKTRRGNAFRYNQEIKPSNKYQVGGYIFALRNMLNMTHSNANHGAILEIDREGSNFAREHHFNYLDSVASDVNRAFSYVKEISEQEKPPSTLDPKITRNNNKGPDSIKAELPWQCSYCDFRGHSCPGAIPEKFDDDLGKVVGHIKDGKFEEKYSGIEKYINLDDCTDDCSVS